MAKDKKKLFDLSDVSEYLRKYELLSKVRRCIQCILQTPGKCHRMSFMQMCEFEKSKSINYFCIFILFIRNEI